MTNIASECRSAKIVRDHAMILPDEAAPKPDGIFGKHRGLSMSTRPGYLAHMLSRPRTPAGFIQPCLPTKAQRPPSWLHEIKHDGFRVIARKDGLRVKLYSRPGNDLTGRFPLIVEALARLRQGARVIEDSRQKRFA